MIWLYIVIVFILIIVVIFVLFPSLFRADYEKKFKKDFYPKLRNMLETDTDKDDIIVLFKSLSRKWDIKFSLAWLLEDFLSNHAPKPETTELLKEIIEEEKTLRPFENMPAEEKRIIETIMLLLKDKQHDNREQIMVNLQQLGTTINTRDAIYKLAEKENKRSLKYAKIGVTLTILTSVIGIILTANSIDYERIEKSDYKTDEIILQKLDSLGNALRDRPDIN